MNPAEAQRKIVTKALSDPDFRKALVKNPKQTIANELHALDADLELPDNMEISVLEESESQRYLVLPFVPEDLQGQELSEEELSRIAGGVLGHSAPGTGQGFTPGYGTILSNPRRTGNPSGGTRIP